MMARYFKAPNLNAMLPGRVGLFLVKQEEQSRGRLLLPPGVTPKGESKFTVGDGPAKDVALAAGIYADECKTDVDVSDPDSLWQSDWGMLER
jgi:hypothetical protein